MATETVSNIPPIINILDSPRISFSSADFLQDEANFISISPHQDQITDNNRAPRAGLDFEFLSSTAAMLSAEELICDGKLVPFLQTHQAEKLNKISLQPNDGSLNPDGGAGRRVTITISNNTDKDKNRVSWFVDDDPSPRPPKCTVLWKELLRLKKQRRPSSTLSPSSSSSSTSSSSSSLADVATEEEKKAAGGGNKDKQQQQSKRIKKGLERTTIRIRPMINVPICTQTKTSSLPPLFPLRKNRVLER